MRCMSDSGPFYASHCPVGNALCPQSPIMAMYFPAQLASGTSAPTACLTRLSQARFESNLFKKLTVVESDGGTFPGTQEECNAEREVSTVASCKQKFLSLLV